MTLQLNEATLTIDTADFFGLDHVDRIATSIDIELTDHSYLPKADEPRADWVASVAVPAFKTLARLGTLAPSFCTIGTGAGTDVLAAVEILRARTVGFTDLHEDVVQQARANVERNLVADDIELVAAAGDILAPFVDDVSDVDVVYENLPNIPVTGNEEMSAGQTSSTFLSERTEDLPGFVTQHLLTLHYLALAQARPVLRDGGHVLSSIGARIPLAEILRLAAVSGYNGRILTYGWKIQSEPEEVVGGYATWERAGLGPFTFYPVDLLTDVFAGVSPATAGAQAQQIEQALSLHGLSAQQALAMVREGQQVGHTVAVLDSVKISEVEG